MCREFSKKNSRKWTHLHRNPAETQDIALQVDRIQLLARAKKLQCCTQDHSSAISNIGKDHYWNTKLTLSSWEHGRRNYKLSRKCKTGGLEAQTSEAFTGDCIQISKSPALMLEKSPDSIPIKS
jgi:hypothetical protein